ncbi:MAG: flagellar biosynthesis anti-sigma factor FlgM [Nitrospirota bacterium]|nr:flagellar biosynthesis anti-sigma factor FlgM [Nitrospirota bacterium]
MENTVSSSSPDSVKGTSASSSSPSMDVVSLSIPTQEVSHYLEQMSQIPDIRQERITHIQKALASNSYVVSPEKLADKFLDELHSQPQGNRPSTAS